MKKVTAALLVKDGMILIAKRKAGGQQGGKWEFPGGKMEEGESPEECLARELQEELNIKAKIGNFFAESVYEYSHGIISLLAYWAFWLEGEIELRAHTEYRWASPGELSSYDFALADLPFISKLKREEIEKI